MASLPNKAASSSTDQKHYMYEVFLSFRGKDTRFNFTDHLYTALCQRGIQTFRDADKLRRGEEISAALLKAIEESRVTIVVFSQNYASSRWCLDELVKILECRKSKGQEVISVFYKVDPSHVRHQTGAFGDAFATLDQFKYKDSMDKWREALSDAANLSGWTYEEDRSEAEFIKDIVGDLSARIVNPSCVLQVAANPIGLEPCRQDVNRLLDVEENNMVGIWGSGGIGKTTIAKDVFNSIRYKFEASCFLPDVRSNDIAQLQETLLSDILNDLTLKVRNVDKGVGLIKTRMRNKKVLLVFDDVSHSSQLQNLIPSPDCFGPGSRCIITTRDKHLLTAHQVAVYEVKMLDYDRALELFSLNAFKRNGPPSDYLKLARRAIRYAQGLPLALIVLGSHLSGRSIEEWEATISSCNGGPQTEIHDVLKLSYDALGPDLKAQFLDIACFFKGEQVDRVKPILEACYGLKSVSGIPQLEEKALIRIDKDGWSGCRIWMHDLIEEMGKDIVYLESPVEPGKRSRVWQREDVDHILTNNTGTNIVLGIQVSWCERSSTISLNAKSFLKMKNLRYISMVKDLEYESFSGNIDYLSSQLRWLDWPNSPLRSFPSDFHASKLVKLNIPNSRRITRLWERHKNFSSLTSMNLRGCESLTELPDLSEIPNLKEFDLSECTSLVEAPDSLRLLDKLVTLHVDHCENFIRFPRKINFKSVETVSISYCKLEEFSEVGKEMSFLRKLDLSGTCIKELHPSITILIRLEDLKVRNCKNFTTLPYNIYELSNLNFLDARDCPKLATFPKIPIKMDSLKSLNLSHSNIRGLDQSIRNLIGLQALDLTGCKNLKTLPDSIYELQNLRTLSLYDCSKLVRFPRKTDILNVDGCPLSLPKLRWFHIGGCRLSDCDFLVTLDCWETLIWLDLSRNYFISLPACITKFVNLRRLDLYGCKKLRGIPELPPNVHIDTSGCELLEERFSTLTNLGAMIEASSSWHRTAEEPSMDFSFSSANLKRHCTAEEPSMASPAEPTLSRFSLSSETAKRHRTAEEPSMASSTESTLSRYSLPFETPSTHTPGDGIAMAGNFPNASNVPKSLMMCGTDGTGGLASSTNQLEDIDQFGDVGSLGDDVESFLSHDDGEGRDLFGTLNRNPAHSTEASKDFFFNEVGSIRKSSSKVVCCHFSSDGKLLASAGHDKKVVIWNMETLQTESTPEDHSLIITDVRFRPNSTQLATSSFDTTVRLWDAAGPSYCLHTYKGHTSHVRSLDFHPKKTDLFCSCDTNNEIRFWNINQYSCIRVSKGGSSQVKFQPRIGQFMAAASGNVVSIFDAESDRQTHSLQGHSTEVHSLCWDTNGDYLTSVSQESVRVWSLSSGKCIHKLSSSGNMFRSCVFHPSYCTLLVIGGYKSMELWNMAVNKCMTVAAHDCVISALAQSPVSRIVASASQDKSVKIWK